MMPPVFGAPHPPPLPFLKGFGVDSGTPEPYTSRSPNLKLLLHPSELLEALAWRRRRVWEACRFGDGSLNFEAFKGLPT